MACLQVKLCVAISEHFRKCFWYLKALLKCRGLLRFTYFALLATTFCFCLTGLFIRSYCRLALRASGNLLVSYVLTGNLPPINYQ